MHLPFTHMVPAGQQVVPQTARPSGQVLTHLPPTQWVPEGQILPQAPQLALSVLVLTHTGATVPQRVVPFAQPHFPLTQTWPAGQIVPQAPQLALSLFRLTHTSPQRVVPLGQPPQCPCAHSSPRLQRWPQLPQLRTSVARLVHLPWQQVPLQQTREAAVSPQRWLFDEHATHTFWQRSRLSSPWKRLQYSWQSSFRSVSAAFEFAAEAKE